MLLLALAVALTAVSVPSSVHAASDVKGKVCKTRNDATRCASIRAASSVTRYIWPGASTKGHDGAQVRITRLQLQRKVDGGWLTVRQESPPSTYDPLDGQNFGVHCSDLRRGAYRARAKSRWVANGSHYSGWVASRAVKKGRLC